MIKNKQFIIKKNINFYKKKSKNIKQLLRYNYKTVLSWKEYIIPLFKYRDWHGMTSTMSYKWKCSICGKEFESKIRYNNFNKKFPNMPRCFHCFPKLNGISMEEKEITNLCKSLFDDVIENDKLLISPYELDMIIPHLKIAIEFNGNKWHSLEFSNQKYKDDKYFGYHLNKTVMCENIGYRLIHIWEDEWIKNKNTIIKKLIDVFNNNEHFKFKHNIIRLDRSWYTKNINIPGYKFIAETDPEIIKRGKYSVENCGYLIFKKDKK